jgi:4-amino-4-deoxy-L-arabinose transferase-like glycosyltransferase
MMFALAALTAWLYVDEGDRRWAVLLAVFAAAAAATKQEGSLFAPLLVVATLAFARQSGRPLRPVLTAGGFLVASMVPWLIWIRVHHAAKTNGDVPIGKSVDPGYLLDRLDRLPVAVHEMTRQAVRPSSWILILPLAVILSVVALRSKQQRRLATFTLAVLVVSTAPVLWAYWVGRPEIHWYVTHSARRTVTSAVLAAGVLLPLLTEQFAGRTPTAGSADDAARVSQRGRHRTRRGRR